MNLINTKKQETNVMIEFSVFGEDFDPCVITEILKITPKLIWRKGDKIGERNLFRQENCWVFGTNYEVSLDIDEQLSSLLEVLQPCKRKLIQLKEELKIEYGLEVVINIVQGQTPAMYLGKDIIKFCNDIGVTIDVDLYVL